MNTVSLEEKILRILRSKKTPKVTRVELQRLIRVTKKNKAFSFAINNLLENKKICKDKTHFSLKKAQYKTGVISINYSGVGFVDFSDNTPSLFIPPRFLNNALNADLVKVKIFPDRGSDKSVGKVVQIIKSTYEKVIGQVVTDKKGGYFLNPLRSKTPIIKIINFAQLKKIKLDDWVEIEVCPKRQKNYLEGKILRKIEQNNTLLTELEALICEFDLSRPYSQGDEEYAKSLKPRKMQRRDLRSLRTVTIDPFNAQDFDDALSIYYSDEQHLVVAVHIADVASYVTPNSRLHKIIRQRCFTAYLPGMTLPMLPTVLVKDRCSLIEGEDKLAHTVLLYIDKQSGKVTKSERFYSHINVNKRLNYSQVQEFIDTGYTSREIEQEYWNDLKELFRVSKTMRKFRSLKEKFLDLESSEFEVLCDYETVQIRDICEKKSLSSCQLVEEFMLATNVEVAKELNDKKIAGIFRTHSSPDEESLYQLEGELKASFDVEVNNLIHRKYVSKLLKDIKNHTCKQIITFKILRAMQRASYKVLPQLHYGLGKYFYSHFTSPIRRYSDLLVHQQLFSYDKGKLFYNKKALAKEVIHINKKEENIDLATREINNRFKMHYFKKLKEQGVENYSAIISGIHKKGCSVYLLDYGLYCFMNYKTFGGACCDELCSKIFDARNNKFYSCGDSITVAIESIDFRKYELNLKLAK